MNDYLLSTALGVLEGLTEFLPVSSTAHLRIAEALMGLDLGSGFWKMFAIVIQIGAILALPLYFWGRIGEFVRSFPAGRRGNRTVWNHPLSITLIAFVCTAGPAFLLHKVIGRNLERLSLIGWALVLGGVIMWIVDVVFADNSRTASMDDMSLTQGVWIGLCQILSAVFPGTSRSMSTIAAGQLAGMSRQAALEFSFFLSMPTMAAAVGYDLFHSLRHHMGDEAGDTVAMNGHNWALLALGTVVSFIVAYAVVAWFMDWVKKRGFVPFAVYRIAAGAALLYWVMHNRVH